MAKVKHIALFRFRDDARATDVQFVLDSIQKLTTTLPGIEDYAAGPGTSSEGNQGFTHAFVMTFADPRAKDAYLAHPDHVRVQKEVLPFVARAVMFDFEA